MNALPKEEPSIEEILRGLLADSSGDVAEAGKAMVEFLKSRPDILTIYLDEILYRWATERLRNANVTQRRSLLGSRQSAGGPPRLQVVDGSTFRDAVAANYSRLMDTPLWGGKKLGDATADEIRQSAAEYNSYGKTYLHKARWQLAVADAAEKNGVGPTDIVKQSLSETTLAKLWEATSGDQA